MLVFPHAKINLGLQILRKRTDGYHDIASCFYPIAWSDALEIIDSPEFSFTIEGLSVPGDLNANLCVKAFDLLKSDFDLPPVEMVLLKNIPMGAGLGGGSADAAFAINLLNDHFGLGLDVAQRRAYAAKLGADCAFFIDAQPTLAKGIGTEFSPVSINLNEWFVVVAHPGVHVSTADAYRQVDPAIPDEALEDILSLHPSKWKGRLKNDFEGSVFSKYPEVGVLKQALYEQGATYASMSGSGSAVFAIFENKPAIELPQTYAVWQGGL